MTGQCRVAKATRGKAANSGELSDKDKTRLQGIGFSEELFEGLLMAPTTTASKASRYMLCKQLVATSPLLKHKPMLNYQDKPKSPDLDPFSFVRHCSWPLF